MKIKLKQLTVLLFLFFSFFAQKSIAQSNNNINSAWDNYYNLNPSGIRNNHQSSDFINIIEKVNFIPKMNSIKGNQQILKKVVLMLSQEDLNQMSITGDYFSRTYKHDDYYKLYNMDYNPISKEMWDRLCPYLIPLMEIDGTLVNLR